VSNKKAIYCLIEALIEIYKEKEMPAKLPALKALLKIVEK
jgi:hypothetical protein